MNAIKTISLITQIVSAILSVLANNQNTSTNNQPSQNPT